MKIRIIQSSNQTGAREEVYFTEDFDTFAEDFITSGLTLDEDSICDCELPSGFPMDYILRRE